MFQIVIHVGSHLKIGPFWQKLLGFVCKAKQQGHPNESVPAC